MELLIVTGMSGAGKTSALRIFEDMGYHCIDNIPVSLMLSFAEFCRNASSNFQQTVFVVDSRSGDMTKSFVEQLQQFDAQKIKYQVLYLDCNNTVLHHRYKEYRRRHPLLSQTKGSLIEAIEIERKQMEFARQRATMVIDTTYLNSKQLRERLQQFFCKEKSVLEINIISFGFKYGIPSDADFVFDVRCLPNPFYINELRNRTGEDEEVSKFVFSSQDAEIYKNKIIDMLHSLFPLFVGEGKSNVVIAIGCTGGQHRSVAFAKEISSFCQSIGYTTNTLHRDIEKDREV